MLNTNTTDYEQAIGVPDIVWGDTDPFNDDAPNRPLDWSTEVPGYYYINPSDNNATDINNPFGTPDQPRATLPQDVDPGGYVELHGTFGTETMRINWQGTEEDPIWLRGDASGDLLMTGFMQIRDASYVIAENLDFGGGTVGGPINIDGASHHITIRNSDIHDRAQPAGASAGISINPSNGQHVHDIIIHNNNFENLGDWTVTEDLDFHGVAPSLWGRDETAELSDVWITENYFTHLSGDGVQVNAGNWTNSQDYLHHVYIADNESYQNRQAGVWLKQGSDIIVSQNVSHGSDGNGGANAGAAFGMQYDKDNVWFLFNEAYDSVYGFRQSDTNPAENIYMIGNLIHDIRPSQKTFDAGEYSATDAWEEGAAIALWHGSSSRFIVDNTIHNVYDGVNAIFNGEIEMHGNIISQIDDETGNRFFNLTHPARNDNVDLDYNLYIDDMPERYFSWWEDSVGSVAYEMTSLADVQHYSGQAQNSISLQGDSSSIFKDAANGDFSLVEGSQAIGAGSRHEVYDIFLQLYGIDIDVDFYGNARPETGRSIGAFETESGPNGGDGGLPGWVTRVTDGEQLAEELGNADGGEALLLQASSDNFVIRLEKADGVTGEARITDRMPTDQVGSNDLTVVFDGSEGHDTLAGMTHDDTLVGGAGIDRMFGDGGSDTFVFEVGTGLDIVYDFVDGVDRIRLDGLGFNDLDITEHENTGSLIRAGDDYMILRNVDFANLTVDDFFV